MRAKRCYNRGPSLVVDESGSSCCPVAVGPRWQGKRNLGSNQALPPPAERWQRGLKRHFRSSSGPKSFRSCPSRDEPVVPESVGRRGERRHRCSVRTGERSLITSLHSVEVMEVKWDQTTVIYQNHESFCICVPQNKCAVTKVNMGH